MFLTIAALVLSLAQLGNDSIEPALIQLEESVCMFFDEPTQDVAVVEVNDNAAEEDISKSSESSESEVAAATSEPRDAEQSTVAADLNPASEPDTVETTASAPETTVIEESVAAAVVETQAEEEVATVEDVVAEVAEVEEASVATDDDPAQQIAAQWSQLSNEARESILLLIEIDLNTQEAAE